MKICEYNPQKHYDELYALHVEYTDWVVGQHKKHYDVEVFLGGKATQIDKFTKEFLENSQSYVIYLIEKNNVFVGMGMLRKLTQNIAEIKRMYVKPEYRGMGIGKQIFVSLLDRAKKEKYDKIRLDTAKYMKTAQGLYHKMGFRQIESYPGSEIPPEFHKYAVFMEKTL